MAGQVATAPKHARSTVKIAPLSVDSWRLLDLCASGPLGAPGAAFDLAREHRVSVDFESWLPKGFRVRSGPGSIQFETLHEHG